MEKANSGIICLNAQGFIRHKDEIENEIVDKWRPIVLGLTETHVTSDVEDHEVQIDGYVCVRGNSESSRTGGVLLYIDRAMSYEVLEVDICEGNWWVVVVRISDRNYKGILILIYRSPSGSDAKLLNFMEEMCNRDITEGNVIIMGDFNINMKDKNYCQKKLLRTMNSAGLKQMVKEPTRVVHRSESIIDLVFTNYEVEVIVKHEPKITDHSTIVIDWKIKLTNKEDKIVICRDYKRMDVDKFMRIIDKGMNVIVYEEVDMLANAIVNTIKRGLDKVAPRRQIKLHGRCKGKQWFTEDIRLMMRQRDKAYSKARISRNEED